MSDSKDKTVEILDRHLDGDFTVFPMAPRTATEADIEKYRGVLPDDYLAHVTGEFAGIWVEAKEKVWRRPKEFEIGPFWSFLYGIHTFSPVADSEDWMRIDGDHKYPKGALPILKVIGDADVYCVLKGKIVRFNHETNELKPEKIDFWTLFERELAELKARKERKLAEKKKSAKKKPAKKKKKKTTTKTKTSPKPKTKKKAKKKSKR